MKQIIQSYKTGEMILEEVPVPQAAPGMVLVETMATLISAGTERMLVDLARKSLVGKARSRPDLVKKVIDKARKEGLANTIQKVRSRLDTPIPLGYACAGVVREVGDGVDEFQPGDRVACGGAGYANHAEFNVVPRNLCVRLPERNGEPLPAEEAAFATVGAIALQGVRQAGLTLGERVAVIGLGLLGQLTVQLCKANGCSVLGSDIEPARMALALRLGADRTSAPDDLEEEVPAFTQGSGADAVIITAAASDSRLIELAGEISRAKGRVVVVGLVGLNVPRDVYYRKELDLRLSMSYGPGRYDPEYEERGHDYPLPYVRWTEQRNMQAFLELVAAGRVDVKALITHRFPFEKALDAYEMILKGSEPHLAVIFEYGKDKQPRKRVALAAAVPAKADRVALGVFGAGNFARGVLLPRFKENPAVALRAVATARGMTANAVAKQFGIPVCANAKDEILADAGINAVLIATRHNLHGPLVVEALKAGKHVFVEKPLCLSILQLREIMDCHAGLAGSGSASPPLLMTGFNRRFSPLVRTAAEALRPMPGPMFACYTVNAGLIPKASWVQDPVEGGGRIIGEVCHFVDTLRFLAGSPVASVQAMCVQGDDRRAVNRDSVSIILKYANGSVGTILYHALGSPDYPKERLEASAGGTTAVLDDFRRLDIFGAKKATSKGTQDKGFKEEVEAFVNCLAGKGPVPIPPGEIFETTLVTFAVHHALNTGRIVALADFAQENGLALP
ncbi:MAG TPA: bi-domain-containing oxidoreductase [Syntrophales bacterium]|nr:bi-domain-containing oxidoreductase [Syntrophales bacterium]